MEKNQYKLCIEILKRLNAVGVLDDCILIGSGDRNPKDSQKCSGKYFEERK